MNLCFANFLGPLKDGIVGLLLMLDSFVYELISSAYKIFMAIAGARLLSADAFTMIANKLYVIIGVAMLFVLAYAILRGIIDPDQITKGDMGGPKMLKSVLIAIIGLALAPVLFNLLYQAQSVVLENDVLIKLFFRTDGDSVDAGSVTLGEGENSKTYDIGNVEYNDIIKDNGGALTAATIWQAFFYPADIENKDADAIEGATKEYISGKVAFGACAAAGAGIAFGLMGATFGLSLLVGAAVGLACVDMNSTVNDSLAQIVGDTMTLNEAYTYAAQTGDFGIFQCFLERWSDGDIKYVMVISTIIGMFVLYAFVSFSIDMGVRAAKLAYYQIIAPIPLILQVLPSFQSNFKTYIKKIFATFLEVFIRIIVVYIVVYIICHITELFSSDSDLWGVLGPVEAMFARALLIVGLVIFAKQAPKLISDSLGIQSGNLSLGIGKKLAEGGAFAAAGVAGGAITGAVRNFTKGFGNTKGATLTQRMKTGAKAVASGMAGGASGAFNSARTAYGMMKGGNPVTPHQMREIAKEGAKKAGDNREKRADFKKDNKNYKGKVLKGVAGARVNKAMNALSKWAVGPSYSEHDSKLEKTLGGVKDLKKNYLKDTVANVDYVRNKEYERDRLLRMDVEDIAYEQMIDKELKKTADQRRKSAKERLFRAKKNTESQAEYEAAFNTWYADENNKNAYDAELKTLETNERRQIAEHHPKSSYFVAVGSEEYNEAQKELDSRIKKVKKEYDDAVDKAIGENLVKGASGVENNTTRALKKFFEEYGSSIREFENVEFKDDNGQITTLGKYIEQAFGANATVGTPDYIKIASDTLANSQSMKVDLSTGEKNADGSDKDPVAQIIIKKSDDGSSSTVQFVDLTDVDASGNHPTIRDPETNQPVDLNDHDAVARLVKRLGLKKAKFDENVNSTQIIKDAVTDAERQYDKFTSTREYTDRLVRKAKENDNKK